MHTRKEASVWRSQSAGYGAVLQRDEEPHLARPRRPPNPRRRSSLRPEPGCRARERVNRKPACPSKDRRSKMRSSARPERFPTGWLLIASYRRDRRLAQCPAGRVACARGHPAPQLLPIGPTDDEEDRHQHLDGTALERGFYRDRRSPAIRFRDGQPKCSFGATWLMMLRRGRHTLAANKACRRSPARDPRLAPQHRWRCSIWSIASGSFRVAFTSARSRRLVGDASHPPAAIVSIPRNLIRFLGRSLVASCLAWRLTSSSQ